jgi:4-amino-4-deoxy-L-arabinose transferase-like glycosyltransferase
MNTVSLMLRDVAVKKPMLRHFFWMLPVSLSVGAVLSYLQPGNWLTGWLAFSLLLLLSFWLFVLLQRWAGGSRMLAWMVALAFALRLFSGVAVYLALPVDGHDDPDDRAGFIFTDAHRRDAQAWDLARSGDPILSAFNKRFHTDQYGGLLAFTSLAYRYLSPGAHRVILLILLSALIAALGMPFFWRAARQVFGEQVALFAGWILVLYPENILLGGAAMREPYLITFGALALWGFVDWQYNHSSRIWLFPAGMIWLGLGLLGMLLVSPVVAMVTLVILAGWLWMVRQHGRFSWLSIFIAALIFLAGLALLTWALNRQGNFAGGPLGVLSGWFREVIKWDVYQLKRDSGWVQKLFDEMPAWLNLPFVMVYGIFQPVLPATFIEPTTFTWHIIVIARSLGWYLLWPLLLYAFIAAWKNDNPRERYLWFWFTLISWMWIILTALRGGADQWDNPRYRAILLLWQALAAGYALACSRLRSDVWLVRIFLVEGIFLAVFTQWYISRYYNLGSQIPFGWMVGLIIGSSLLVLVGGGLWDRHKHRKTAA